MASQARHEMDARNETIASRFVVPKAERKQISIRIRIKKEETG